MKCGMPKNGLYRCGCRVPSSTTFIWISHKLKAIFFENPKGASSTIKRLVQIKPGAKIGKYGFMVLSPKDLLNYDNYFKFGICRNPWDKMVSVWKMFTQWSYRQGQLKFLWGVKNPSSIGFEKFLELMSTKPANHHWELQTVFLNPGYCLDYVGRLENFQSSMKHICQRIEVPYEEQKKQNTTSHEPYESYYNERTRTYVATRYLEDIEVFGYRFGEAE